MEPTPFSKYLVKVRHIVPTLFYILITSVGGLLFVRWIISVQFDLLDLKEDVWNIWLPLVFPWIPITIWLRPRLRILTRKKESEKLQFGFQGLAWFVIALPMIFSQAYLSSGTGNLIQLDNIAELSKDTRDNYYSIRNFKVLAAFGTSASDVRASGKYNEHLDINLYFAAPITRDSLDSFLKYNCWYGVKYHLQIGNRIEAMEKEKKYNAFYKECISKMNAYKYHELRYFKRVPTSQDKDGFMKAIGRIDSLQMDTAIVLVPIAEAFEDRNGNKLQWLLGSSVIGICLYLFALIWPRYSVTELERQRAGRKPKEDDVVKMFKYLIPKEPHLATSIILDVNILIFLLMVFSGIHIISPNGLELLNWGANGRAEVAEGEWWRLFTSMFVHGGIMHLLLNIFGLVFASTFLETLIGPRRYALIYLLSGLCGSLASIWWHENTISVGASGAIFGLFGAIMSMTFAKGFNWDASKGIFLIFGPYVGINLLFGLVGGIDNAAHIGGLIGGLLTGLIIFKFGTANNEENDSNIT